ncbi:sulfite exporter TauE/SafE family protein [Sedimentimonas flavescens]|uniref:sulfite exporter TauE/SafE family protein n=1 Tax=Sedimentimonas flavescens TaxID=2851012 RepID=UPI001C4A3F5A|nr:sulfite exporter TauE/SafE family protein [Sedimentimonas flavescens]MBW0157185.1 sulfite exporter TauE/SafE family protein [Sedimentimonas flavescens]WBL34507.1 sulfite exporter TauE/SafE family protein [Sinirhodobacter sp. HNIBRBA609]
MTHMETLLPLIAILIAVGAFAGVLAGLLGVGGGIVLVPAFFYLFGGLGYGSDQLMQVCVATSLATIIVTSARSVMAHNRKGAVDWTILKQWAPPIAIGAVVGVLVVAQLRTQTLQIIFGVMLVLIALYMMLGKASWRLSDHLPGLGFRVWFGPLMGFISVLLGIGGGSIGTPMLTLHGVPIHRAVATSAGFGITIALPSAIAFLLTPVATAPPYSVGAVNIPAFLVVIATTTITAPWGAALAHRLDPKRLRQVFAAFLILVALNMLRKALL